MRSDVSIMYQLQYTNQHANGDISLNMQNNIFIVIHCRDYVLSLQKKIPVQGLNPKLVV